MGRSILLVGSYAPSLVNFRGPLITALRTRGWRVITTAPDIDGKTATDIAALGATAISLPMARTGLDPRQDLSYARALISLIRDQGADLVFTYTIKPNIWGAFAAHKAGIPSIAMITGLGYAFTDPAKQDSRFGRALVGQIARLLYRRASGLNTRVIFQNRDDLADFAAAGCLADLSKARLVAGSGVDLDHYLPAPLPAEPSFLMISRLLKNKGVREFCDAALHLKTEMPQLQFDLVGYRDEGQDGIDATELERWIAGGVAYHGPQADVRPFIANASVYVLPSYREGTPRSVLEAMAMGRPIITTDAPGCRETVISGENGILVPVRDIDALAHAMRGLAQDNTLRSRMATASLTLARERFDVHKVNAQIVAVLDEVL